MRQSFAILKAAQQSGPHVSHRDQRRQPLPYLASAIVFLLIVTPAAWSAIRTLSSGPRRDDGNMTIASDQYGTFGSECSVGAYFNPDGEVGSTDWQCVGALLLTNGQDGYWLADEGDPQRLGVLSDDLVISDTVNATRTVRTSSFRVPLADLQVDLIQETPTIGYNFLQTYTFTNKGGQPLSLNIVWFNDQDPHFTGPILPTKQHVGFVPGEIPRAYFIEEADLAGPGDPGIADRNYRMSVAAKMGDRVTLTAITG
jgi:hypothetical protein